MAKAKTSNVATPRKRQKSQYCRGVVTHVVGDNKHLSIERILYFGFFPYVAHQIYEFVVEVKALTWNKKDLWLGEPELRRDGDGVLVVRVQLGCKSAQSRKGLESLFFKRNWQIVTVPQRKEG